MGWNDVGVVEDTDLDQVVQGRRSKSMCAVFAAPSSVPSRRIHVTCVPCSQPVHHGHGVVPLHGRNVQGVDLHAHDDGQGQTVHPHRGFESEVRGSTQVRPARVELFHSPEPVLADPRNPAAVAPSAGLPKTVHDGQRVHVRIELAPEVVHCLNAVGDRRPCPRSGNGRPRRTARLGAIDHALHPGLPLVTAPRPRRRASPVRIAERDVERPGVGHVGHVEADDLARLDLESVVRHRR